MPAQAPVAEFPAVQLESQRGFVAQVHHNLSCRDPLLACMALAGAAEQAHVAGCRTPPLAPMMMHYVNTAADQLTSLYPSCGPSTQPNWWRNVRWMLNQAQLPTLSLANRCCRRACVQEPRMQCRSQRGLLIAPFLDVLSSHAPALVALSARGHVDFRTLALNDPMQPPQPLRLPPFLKLTSLSLRWLSVALDAIVTSAPALTQLKLEACDDVDLSCLDQMRNLRQLTILDVNTQSAEAVVVPDGCDCLEELSIGGPEGQVIRVPTGAQWCSRLRALEIEGPSLDWLSWTVPCLERLTLDKPADNELREVACLYGTTLEIHIRLATFIDLSLLLPLRVTTLCLWLSTETERVDLTPLTALRFLRELDVDVGLSMTNLKVVVGSLQGSASGSTLSRIQVSNVTATAFSDGLFAVPALTDLTITDSRELTTVSHLEGCPALTSLTLERCGVTEDGLAELRHVRRLRSLRLIACHSVPADSEFLEFGAQGLHRTWYRHVTSDAEARSIC